MKIGIFGGTFSPPHNTHIIMAESAVKQLSLDKIFVLPNGIPPHKPCKESKDDRLTMTRLAFGNVDKAVVDTYELDRDGNSYTYLTLEHFREIFPDDELFFVIGSDSLRDFHTWRHPELIAKYATLAVCRRPDSNFETDKKAVTESYGAKICEIIIDQSEISSTRIRIDYQFGIDCRDRVPTAVDEYIKRTGLYQEYKPMVEKLRRALTAKRFSHTYYVVVAGQELFSKIDKDKIFVACLLHDCAKNMDENDFARYGFSPEPNMAKGIVHAPLGVIVAQKDYGVCDKEILDAIRYHTTGKPDMSELEMVVYVADKVEETRPYPVEHLFGETLEETFLNCIEEASEYVAKRQNRTEYEKLTQQAIDFYNKKLRR